MRIYDNIYDDHMMIILWSYDDYMMIIYDYMMIIWWLYDDYMIIIWLLYEYNCIRDIMGYNGRMWWEYNGNLMSWGLEG